MLRAKVYYICQKTLAIWAAFDDDSVAVSNQPLQQMFSVPILLLNLFKT